METRVTPFLMFDGQAKEALELYTSVIPDSKIESISLYGPEGPGAEGTVVQAVATLSGQRLMVIDSPSKHDFTFTASTSLFVDCESESDLESLFAALSEGGSVMMPLDNYGFSQRFGWCADRFGVSWQLNLP